MELLLDRDRAEESESLLNAIAQGRVRAVVSHFAIHAIEAMLLNQQKLSAFLKDVETSKGLTVYDTTVSDEQSVSILSGKIGLDFDDSVQFYVAKRTSSSAIVSFDKHFDGCGIPRREPFQILKELDEEHQRGSHFGDEDEPKTKLQRGQRPQ
jgi:predicted nucleic acid-binding protein